MSPAWKLPRIATGALVALLLHPSPVKALQVTGYSAAKNNRFSSGFPSAPVNNTNPTFVGLGEDFSGVGWSAADPTKGFALLSPIHFLATVHYGGASTIQFANEDGTVYSYTQQSLQATGYGAVLSGTADLALGTLTQPVAASTGITSYAIYDGSYTLSTDILQYGRGPNGTSSPRVGFADLLGGSTGGPSDPSSYLLTSRTNVQLEGGDSGSPAFVQWTAPTGETQLAIVGNNAAIDTTNGYNVLNLLGRAENITAMNAMMAVDGYALRFVSDPNTIWSGNNSNITTAANWTSSLSPNASRYIAFSKDYSAVTSINLQGGTTSAKGVIFDANGTSGYTFTNGTFSIGHGGIHNYDTHAQNFGTNFSLIESQVWDGESGGLNVTGNINNNGYLLLVQGSAANKLSGVISGTGGLAKDGSGIMTVSGANTYSGTTFLHNGTLVINNNTGSGTGSGSFKGNAGTLAGFGRIAGNSTLSAATRLTAGNITSGNIPTLDGVNQANNSLTFGGNVTLNGAFDFYLGSLSETVGFTQIILDGTNPLLALGVASSFNLSASSFVGIDDPNSGNAFWYINHSWKVFDITGAGSITGAFGSINLGSWNQGTFTLVQNDNDFDLIYTAVPEPSSWAFAIGGVLMMGFRLKFRRTAG